jgi:hypothetical protein
MFMSDTDIEMLIEAEPFARGTARHAYRMKSDPNAIVKKSVQPRNYSNFLKWTIWLGSEPHPQLKNVLGRCHCLSVTGKYLIMERLDDIEQADYRLIGDVPAWCDDTKPSAFGKRKGVIKIRDYGKVRYSDLLNQSLVKPPAFALSARTQALIDGSTSGCQ